MAAYAFALQPPCSGTTQKQIYRETKKCWLLCHINHDGDHDDDDPARAPHDRSLVGVHRRPQVGSDGPGRSRFGELPAAGGFVFLTCTPSAKKNPWNVQTWKKSDIKSLFFEHLPVSKSHAPWQKYGSQAMKKAVWAGPSYFRAPVLALSRSWSKCANFSWHACHKWPAQVSARPVELYKTGGAVQTSMQTPVQMSPGCHNMKGYGFPP